MAFNPGISFPKVEEFGWCINERVHEIGRNIFATNVLLHKNNLLELTES